MGALADIRSGVDSVLTALGDSVQYRSAQGGAWTDLAQALITVDRPAGMVFDDAEGGDVERSYASLICSVSSAALAMGWQIKDWRGIVWSVASDPHRSVAAVRYRLRRETTSDVASYDRPGREV